MCLSCEFLVVPWQFSSLGFLLDLYEQGTKEGLQRNTIDSNNACVKTVKEALWGLGFPYFFRASRKTMTLDLVQFQHQRSNSASKLQSQQLAHQKVIWADS